MPFQFLPADQWIKDTIQIYLSKDPPPVGGAVASDETDEEGNPQIPIQFPPRLSTDGKKGNWKTYDVSSYEPVAIFSGSEARRISVELTYVITGGKWTGRKISKIERLIKSYFYRKVEDAIDNTPMVVIKQLYGVTLAYAKTTWRMNSVDITPGEGIILEESNGVQRAYPLSRKIVIELETYTQLGGRGGDDPAADEALQGLGDAANVNKPPPPKSPEPPPEGAPGGNSSGGEEEVKQFQTNLEPVVKASWY